MSNVELRIGDAEPFAQYELRGATCDEQGEVPQSVVRDIAKRLALSCEDGILRLGNIDADTTTNILVPFVDAPHGDVAGVRCNQRRRPNKLTL
jgi:hypothetical protein